MNRTYSDLKGGGVLAVGDTLLLHGYEHDVREAAGVYFLNNSCFANCRVFEKFDRDRYDWAKMFGSTCSGDFPEFRSLQDLTNFVVSIYEEPEFKAGDYVTINERKCPSSDYPASFVDDMTTLCGKTFKIKSVMPADWIGNYKLCNGELHLYELCGTGYNWHPSMFRKATEEEILAAQGTKGDARVKCDRGSSSDSIAVDTDTQKCESVSLEEVRSWEEILGGNTDCALRLPKNTNKTPHINL